MFPETWASLPSDVAPSRLRIRTGAARAYLALPRLATISLRVGVDRGRRILSCDNHGPGLVRSLSSARVPAIPAPPSLGKESLALRPLKPPAPGALSRGADDQRGRAAPHEHGARQTSPPRRFAPGLLPGPRRRFVFARAGSLVTTGARTRLPYAVRIFAGARTAETSPGVRVPGLSGRCASVFLRRGVR